MLFVRLSTPAALLLTILFVTGCGEQSPEAATARLDRQVADANPTATQFPKPVTRPRDFARLARGGQLYQQYCASCHGDRAQGDPNWRQRGGDGRFPPPPLDGSAHTWHHPMDQLKRVIREGGPPGQSNMPGWGDTLSERQIEDIILWFQSLWPDKTYQTWAEMDTRTRAQG